MKELIRFQTDRTLDKKEYNALNEHGNIIEELLESIGLDVAKADRPRLKEAIDDFITQISLHDDIAIKRFDTVFDTPLEEQVDAYCDIITFATGALLKLGYDPEKAIVECGKEINSSVGSMVDGKFEKDLSEEAKSNWYKADYSKAKL